MYFKILNKIELINQKSNDKIGNPVCILNNISHCFETNYRPKKNVTSYVFNSITTRTKLLKINEVITELF